MTDAAWTSLREAVRTWIGLWMPLSMRDNLDRASRELGIDLENGFAARATEQQREQLLDRLYLGATWFARELAGIDALVRALAPEALRRRDRAVSIWCAGCATGQEPYTIAMAFADAGCSPQVIATDFHRPSLAIACEARYPSRVLDRLPDTWPAKYFEPASSGTVRVAPEIRRCVRFERHDFATEPPIALALDAVVCRNALIYFERDDAIRAVGRLVFACRDDGFLLLGALETPLLWVAVNDPRLGATAPLVRVSARSPLRTPLAATPTMVTPRSATPIAAAKDHPATTAALAHSRQLERSAEFREGVKALDQAATRAPLNAAVHLARGLLLKQTGDLTGAIRALRFSRFLDPYSWLAPYELATCLELAQEPEEALEAYRHAVTAIDAGGKAGLVPHDEDVEMLATTVVVASRAKLANR